MDIPQPYLSLNVGIKIATLILGLIWIAAMWVMLKR